jgi:hypothetical protein
MELAVKEPGRAEIKKAYKIVRNIIIRGVYAYI